MKTANKKSKNSDRDKSSERGKPTERPEKLRTLTSSELRHAAGGKNNFWAI